MDSEQEQQLRLARARVELVTALSDTAAKNNLSWSEQTFLLIELASYRLSKVLRSPRRIKS